MAQEQQQSQKLLEQIEALKKDVTLWRSNYEKLEAQNRELGAQIVQQSSELVAAKDKIDEAVAVADAAIHQRNAAIKHLQTLAYHTAGRDGVLAKSKTFCGICENPMSCPMRAANEFLDLHTPKEQVAA